jgi:hypothetical protein
MALDRRLLDELLAMQQRDLTVRARLLEEGRLYGAYAEDMQQVHRENAERLNDLVERHGWPGIALVTLEGCRAAWFIAQHANCTPHLQRKFLALISAAAEAGDVPKLQAAFLTDRIRFNENRPQLYGTVLDWDDKGELGCPVEDPEGRDARRQSVGLPPFEESLRMHWKEVAAEGGAPPHDLAEYRRSAHAWARSVGWERQE